MVQWLSSWLADQGVRVRFLALPLEFQRLVIACFHVAIWLILKTISTSTSIFQLFLDGARSLNLSPRNDTVSV